MSMNSKWFILFKKYITHSHKYWGEKSHRQNIKLINRLNKIKKAELLNTDETLNEIYALVTLRKRRRRSTLYISNIGSSGSHWLQAMLMEFEYVFGVGEVYFPPKLIKDASALSNMDRFKLIDAIHVLHTGCLDPRLIEASIINTAHTANQTYFLNIDTKAVRILLVRHPIKICESRTFRKNEYKNYLHTSINDELYLDENIKKITSFYQKALECNYTMLIRYEDLLKNPSSIMTSLRNILQVDESDVKIDAIIEKKSKNNIKENSNTNLYKGSSIYIKKSFHQKMENDFEHLTKQLGYTLLND